MQDLTRDELLELIARQHDFTESLRDAANKYAAHAGHCISNYADGKIPDDKLRELSQAQIRFTDYSITPSPIARGGREN